MPNNAIGFLTIVGEERCDYEIEGKHRIADILPEFVHGVVTGPQGYLSTSENTERLRVSFGGGAAGFATRDTASMKF